MTQVINLNNMTIIQLNNENKTQVEFTYDNGLPYKKEIRPECEYGDWSEKPDYCLIKMFLCDDEFKHFKNKKFIPYGFETEFRE